MEVVDGVEVENNQVTFESKSNARNENEVIDGSTDGLNVNNGEPGDPPPMSEGTSSAAPKSNASTLPKKIGSSKAQKDGEGQNGIGGITKNRRGVLSQSTSFPSGVSVASTSKKSTTVVKSSPSEFGFGGDAVRKSWPVKSGSANHEARSELIKSNNGDAKLLKQTVAAKNDDDVNSTTSSIGPSAMSRRKSTGSGFSSRLEERAEKRKEFFSKLEEKTHAKELEKTNMQEKSKESQDAELRRLRKSLTFKAAPMPSFYQEPVPPKVELKKIPPTRARSPKLGRHKPSTTVTNDSSEGSISTRNANLNKSNEGTANGSAALKKPAQKSLSKPPSQKSAVVKSDLKPKVSNEKPRTEVPEVEGTCATIEAVSSETVTESTDPGVTTSGVNDIPQ